MTFYKRISLLVAISLLSVSAWALDLNGAMSALGSAKAQGLVGEQADGYLGVVSASGNASEVAKLINQARRAEYERLAKQNNISLGDVQAIAGKKAIEKTPAGQYVNAGTGWQKK